MASGYSDLSEIRKESVYDRYHKPPKINLINERPRRESLVEHDLATRIIRPNRASLETIPAQTMSYQNQSSSTLLHNQPPAAYHYYHQQQHQDSSYSELENELAQKEARLKREIAHMNQYLSPWARPRQIREPRREPESRHARDQQRWVKECPKSPSTSRPTSRAASSAENDLMDRASQLLMEAEALEKKPIKTQQILIENGVKRQIESPTRQMDPSSNAGSVHTAIIKVPNTEIDNKSPLPIAFDNFSTLGVRGNIASIGAAPPDTPYPPIFPIVKRTPSPRF